jgi:soluble lytic murein transglycosylase-like protein
VVYENAPENTAQSQAAANADSGLVYWSNTEHRWKPVPAANSSSMRAAHSAADEVRRLIHRAARNDRGFVAEANALRLASTQVQNAPAQRTQMASIQPPQGASWINDLVEKAAIRHSVDPNLVRAIVQVESGFNPHAVSRKGAIGLMQLMPSTAKSLNVSNPYDPAQNVDAGVRHFKQLLDSYNGNLELSLAAYNAGATAVHRSGGVPHYAETRNYVKRITGLYGSNTARLYTNGHPPLEIKRDAQGHLTVSDVD